MPRRQLVLSSYDVVLSVSACSASPRDHNLETLFGYQAEQSVIDLRQLFVKQLHAQNGRPF